MSVRSPARSERGGRCAGLSVWHADGSPQLTPPIATLLSATSSVLAAVVVMALCLLSPAEQRDAPQDDGGREVSYRGTRGIWLLVFGVLSLLFALLAVVPAPDGERSWEIVWSIVSAVVFVHQLCAYQNRVTLRLTPGSPRLGESMQVRWSVDSPVQVSKASATLLGMERTVLDAVRGPNIRTHIVYEAPVSAAGVAVLPAAGVPAFPGTTHSIVWVLRLSVLFPLWPILHLEVPIDVRGAGAGAPPDLGPPAGFAPQEVRFGVRIDGDHRSFAPASRSPVWSRGSAPKRRAAPRCGWSARR
ncbi:hypothetical protein [Nannocystis punicea]|uniref:DUF58 domain-containing protein n=1 Tax=Nannocystis punicea TaxID=2995304 RepID=A0ABY7GWW2_9BACT|nr:hypothetical protein [Nannocystis poenicansa]WAS91412.1 hypothetical protein O0S08_34945 [Nannocystis poenicansa]